MRSDIKISKKSPTAELADAISSFDMLKVAGLLSDHGKFAVQDENYKVLMADREKFLDWLNTCYKRLLPDEKRRDKLPYTIVQSMHRTIGNPIILFDNGKFPLLSARQSREEKSALVITYEENKITEIGFCFLIMKTESPFIYEKRHLIPGI